MRPTLFRRFVAGIAAFAFIVTLGLQGVQAAAMATMKSEMSISMSMMAPSDDVSGVCTNCDGSGKGTAMHCQTVSICAPSIAVLPMAESISVVSQTARFEAENMSFDGRTGTPELHPPKSAALL